MLRYSRRFLIFLVLIAATSLFTLVYLTNSHVHSWREIQDLSQHIGLGEWTASYTKHVEQNSSFVQHPFQAGTAKPPGSNYTKTVVMARMRGDDVGWLDEELPPEIGKAIYVADDPLAPLHPPKNKGHEVMTYLSYIIDHYDQLPDVAIFLHSHRQAWHNADLFGGDAPEMIRRLSPERVSREGYVNMRCEWDPGCPDWMHPGETIKNDFKVEEVLIAKAWAELFPLDAVPNLLAQPCCAQFALSQARMRAIPRDGYLFYRNWLLRTRLKDKVSGRIFEYMWQYIFTGQPTFCPASNICYCDGFGACFVGPEQYDMWGTLKEKRDGINSEWLEWERKGRDVEEAKENGEDPVAKGLDLPEPGMANVYNGRISELQAEMDKLLKEALIRGEDPRIRALESQREWSEGDGF